ncbi:hypothetical protein [Lentzea jiangxiensis]|uniref:hypothetical protein n=1 Tax=Lentzea jiangxiensis TaxID=641025 RepID=UPI00115FEBEB|nr:hypothetical protein [Lentzea jiangxiensis]
MSLQLVQRTGEIEEYRFDQSSFTVLTGPRNSSKTSTLKLIDYCLGDRDGPYSAVGRSIADKYQDVSLTISLNGTHRTIRRSFVRGEYSKVFLDDESDFPVENFSDWIYSQLGWPSLQIPLGRNADTAQQMVALSFRTLLRHIYRKESSWTEFASKEYDYYRVAVVNYFLGLAPNKYERDAREFKLAQAERDLAAAEAVHRDVTDSTNEMIRSVCTQLGLPILVNESGILAAQTELSDHLAELHRRRNEIVGQQMSGESEGDVAATAAGYDPALTQSYQDVSVAVQRAAESIASLRVLVQEHTQSLSLVELDRGRLERLSGAFEVFDELPVRTCPACEQKVDVKREHPDGSCYLCFQPVVADLRKRRVELEQRALDSEKREVEEALARSRYDLEHAIEREQALKSRQAELAGLINDVRSAQLAPFVTALEDIASESAKLIQQRAALPAISQALARQGTAEGVVIAARKEADRAQSAILDDQAFRRIAGERCSKLADRMNEFLRNFQGRGWVGSSVTISQDLTFFVGTRPWNEQLGAEARVLFFLSYSYALLALESDIGQDSFAPSLVILDNPYQHDLAETVVRESLDLIGNLAYRTGGQLITTQSRPAVDLRSPHHEIEMPDEYLFDEL